MRKLLAAAAVLFAVATFGAATASADTDVQPVGSVPIPDGPAQTWIVADLDSGQVLAGRDQNVVHPPASTIKVLLALVVLDELNLDSTVLADVADTQVECNCVGVKPGRTYTARQLLDGLLLVSGNDAANTLAHMLGGQDVAVAKMNAKAASLGASNTRAATPSGLDGPGGSGASSAHDLAVIFRAAMANPVFARVTAEPTAMFPGDNGEQPIVNQDELLQRYPGAIGGKTGFTDAARKTFVGAAARGGRRLVIAMMYGLVHAGGPTYWDQAASLFDWGFALSPQSSIGSL
ncbi:D-alanyl-D-alanine carboxypeptidase [Mycobacterium kubicae]|uniref:D-alanyl-D-alanine carboxypeptidase n=1 Tax=Mycobacterium kubicae TaxID=120959 RepID=A0AAX1JGJ6_9MYCO|nr:D-alanyl-D-alanine carboxypeptidase family protein [Mycobacterium kubicae]MCV7096929.1 D-alanyl-D-alanine carboxypeptidase [Mycobacterium kubicae]OBF22760.1 D-alanyl-D-alanine carboxypeptidase [Mycobacterium kubicae]ORV98638.1 D-alanyl-D-alanine carboxypeptidase [Mycobacterium kubicae]QNI06330.1 D-alanyl-D-alanine carboxypeptidase [Mycobacterium kubicae]QNI11352.1 D-alanyl-D-alanine carboxypeptidase [Mycobacterium kubicae]